VFCKEPVKQELDDSTRLIPHSRGHPGILPGLPARAPDPGLFSGENPGNSRGDLLQV
jgi:hypothetical protein